jgi:hypothetical protein
MQFDSKEPNRPMSREIRKDGGGFMNTCLMCGGKFKPKGRARTCGNRCSESLHRVTSRQGMRDMRQRRKIRDDLDRAGFTVAFKIDRGKLVMSR